MAVACMGCGHFLMLKPSLHFAIKIIYAGSHANIVVLDADGKPVFIDAGFMVFNFKPTLICANFSEALL